MRYPIALLTISIFIFCSCEKEAIEITHNPVDLLEAKNTTTNAERSQTIFEFSVLKHSCFQDKIALSVNIENPSAYGFLWEVNGGHGGHQQKMVGCYCGESATVSVMRLSDGITASSTVNLPSCPELLH